MTASFQIGSAAPVKCVNTFRTERMVMGHYVCSYDIENLNSLYPGEYVSSIKFVPSDDLDWDEAVWDVTLMSVPTV